MNINIQICLLQSIYANLSNKYCNKKSKKMFYYSKAPHDLKPFYKVYVTLEHFVFISYGYYNIFYTYCNKFFSQ